MSEIPYKDKIDSLIPLDALKENYFIFRTKIGYARMPMQNILSIDVLDGKLRIIVNSPDDPYLYVTDRLERIFEKPIDDVKMLSTARPYNLERKK